MITNPNRPDQRHDLTRWNRAGLSRFDYVDGDAAVWLEELRIAVMGLTARGAEFDERLPETWRDRFMQNADQWPDAGEQATFVDALAWKTLYKIFPDQPESGGKRNIRLLAQYAEARGEYGWEIMRAFARAAHVLLGHQNAYANEGYLRTATQWDNIRKLAAMVNHQPAPPSSAITTVGLIVDPAEEPAEIAKGLAMKYTPPEGGAPVIFETLKELKTHPDLNAARAEDWNADPNPINFNDDLWAAGEDVTLAPGGLAVLARQNGSLGATQLVDVDHDTEAGEARLRLNSPGGTWIRGNAELHLTPKDVRRALPRSTDGVLVLKIETSANYSIGSLIRLHYGENDPRQLAVIGNADGHLKLNDTGVDVEPGEEVTVETLVPVSGDGNSILVAEVSGDTLYYLDGSGVIQTSTGTALAAKRLNGDDAPGNLGIEFTGLIGITGYGYVPTPGSKSESATVVGDPPEVVPGAYNARRIVSFAGKPPKGLAIGDFMVMRPLGVGANLALRVEGVVEGSDDYTLQFQTNLTNDLTSFRPDAQEFHGPMTQSIRPKHHDRNPRAAFDGAEVFVTGLESAAKELIRPGRICIVEDERNDTPKPVLAEVLDAFPAHSGLLKVVLTSSTGLGTFRKGWTKLNFNAVQASHGESKSPKTLGSGDGERARQRFVFSAKGVSFVPSSLAETGVAPDMDVVVDGVIWAYRDLIDPTADGTESYSTALNEDDSLTIHFRRRLPTGTNNVLVQRHRIGVGPGGVVPARAFTKPMKKNRYVTAVTQPFASTGGAEREPVEDIRVNAPARLAANGRAVSIQDFARLCQRRSDVWQARARAVADPTSPYDVAIVIVPANGGLVGETLSGELIKFVERNALPGIRVTIEDFGDVNLRLATKIYVDAEKFDKTEVQEAAHATLVSTFSLQVRALGQPVYIAEVVAALETVTGVETAIVQGFGLKPGSPPIMRFGKTAGAVSALFPKPSQVISVAPASASADFTVAVETMP
ncbi:MAG: hypothetical protein AAF415_02575 [Pseudomonadota bacterium]